MSSLLVVEDDLNIQTLLDNFLRADGHEVTLASDGVEALSRFSECRFDLVLLDLMLPKIDGYGVCEVIRQSSQVPIIMITALDGEDHQLRGYDLQVDDYVTKPFSMQVLLRKVSAVLRRCDQRAYTDSESLTHDNLCVSVDTRTVKVAGEEAQLTPKEFDLLVRLLRARGRVLTRELLLENIWGYDFFGEERVVDTHIKNLRRKLGASYIQTVRGVGYRIDAED